MKRSRGSYGLDLAEHQSAFMRSQILMTNETRRINQETNQ